MGNGNNNMMGMVICVVFDTRTSHTHTHNDSTNLHIHFPKSHQLSSQKVYIWFCGMFVALIMPNENVGRLLCNFSVVKSAREIGTCSLGWEEGTE